MSQEKKVTKDGVTVHHDDLMQFTKAAMTKHGDEALKVLIISDNHILRSGLQRILEAQAGIKVLGEMSILNSSGLDVYLSRRPDVVLVDLDPQSTLVLGLIDKVKKHSFKSVILVLNNLGNDDLVRKAINQGATGVVLKMQPPSVLLATIESLCERNFDRATSHASQTMTTSALDTTKMQSLTDRERDIVGLIATGLKNKEIAMRLHISDITVRHHLTSIFNKLGVSDRQKLLILAHEHGLVPMTLDQE